MDLALYARVLGRHQRVLLVGAALAVVLATLSYYRVEMGVPPKLTPRKAEVWQSSASVLLTQRSQVVPVPGVSDPRPLAALAGLYARLATSDAVLKRMSGAGKAAGRFEGISVGDPSRDSALPVVAFIGTGSTPRTAQAVLSQGLRAFLGYVRAQQEASGISKRRRVELRVLNSPQPAVLLEPRKKTLPIVVFLSVLIAAIASVFSLENRRRLSSATEVELKPASQDEVELRPAPEEELDLMPAPQLEPEDESEPEAAPVRRWA